MEGLREHREALRELARLQQELGPARQRLEALELSRAQFEAECNGVLLKADGKLKAAANAEARERQMRKARERDIVGPLDEDGDPGGDAERDTSIDYDAAASETERLQALRLVVAPNHRAEALRWKFGL